MPQFSIVSCVIILFFCAEICNSANLEIQFDINTYGMYLPNVKFIQNTAYSLVQCMDICSRFTYCKSVNFHKGTKMCTLNYKAADPPGTIQPRFFTVPMEGYRYVGKSSFPTGVLKQDCLAHSCDRENLCVESRQCSKWLYNDCGMVDEDPYATTEYPVDGDFDTAIHTCLRAPPGLSGRTTRRCNKKTGQWSPPDFPCPTSCVSPPKVRDEQQVRYEYPGGDLVRAYYTCSSFPDIHVTGSCLRSECRSGENWGWKKPVHISCSRWDCWKPGAYYKGGVSCTVSGRTCQRWDTNKPHHREVIPYNTTAQQNFCRQDRADKPWCYTTDPAVRWEWCEIPRC